MSEYKTDGLFIYEGETALAMGRDEEAAQRIAAALNAQAGAVEDEAAVERAARAIYAECWPLPDDAPFDAACAGERESAYKLARAALAAIKEKDRE